MRIRRWVEKNVWREVCARELGLIDDTVTPSRSPEKKYEKKVERRGRKRINLPDPQLVTSMAENSHARETNYLRKNHWLNEHPYAQPLNVVKKYCDQVFEQPSRRDNFSKKSNLVYKLFNIFWNEKRLPSPEKFLKDVREVNRACNVQNTNKVKQNKIKALRYTVDMGSPKKCGRKRRTKKRRTIDDGEKSAKVLKNKDEVFEIDESWLVEPASDLPQSLMDTIEEIELAKPEFNPSRDLELGRSNSLPIALESSESRVPTKSEEETSSQKQRNASTSLHPKRRISADSEVMLSSERLAETSSIARVTRLSAKNSIRRRSDEQRETGTIVWGNCMGWWPGFIVNPEDVGMFASPGKSWVCWIGEYKISELRERTQIQSFSSSIEERLFETLHTKSLRDPAYRACLETLELINECILEGRPPTRPHHLWARRVLVGIEDLDRVLLHPYPRSVQPRLDQLKRNNSKVTEKYLSEQKEEKSSARREACKPMENKSNLSPVAGHLPLVEQKPGVIAWAKIMGQVWWPAVIIDFRDWGMKEPSFGCQWIVWYGDYTMSQVNYRFFLLFEKGMALIRDYVKNCKRECYRRGVLEAAKDYCSRFGYKTEDWGMEEAFEWFELKDSTSVDIVLPGIPGNSEISQRYPERIVRVLHKHRGECPIAAAREHAIRESEILESRTQFEQLCLMCLENCTEEETDSLEHPFFVGRLCQECSEKYKPTIFAYGEDGKCFFCTVCAGSDTVVMCDDEDCPRVYCTACIKYLIAPNHYDDILVKDPWLCFVCSDENTEGSLVPRCDWKERVSSLFRSNRDSFPNQLETYQGVKRKIRVLSLFDGISAGLVVLKKLGLDVDVYYASEIDPDAEMVSSAHHGAEVKRLGDVRSITEEKVREILPIHLLIGGSPCNDLSLVNPLRLGLHDPNGSGVLFFDYCRIKDLLEKHNGEHFFWMFENVASMPSKYRVEISKHLGRDPELLDSANYSPQHRPRLYWSNLPIVSFPLSSQDLQDVLNPNCNRYALVKKIRTVTTRVNSLKQGRDALKPILMNETNDTLWITELEQIFGFPKHYTDVKNLCATKRQRLIAMSWSVQTIVEIMRPLCNFFTLTTGQS